MNLSSIKEEDEKPSPSKKESVAAIMAKGIKGKMLNFKPENK